MRYAELSVTSTFTFLTGASHPEEMVERAAGLGLSAIAITDRNTLAGVVRAHLRLRELRREAPRIRPRNVTGEDVRRRARIRSETRTDPSSRLSAAEVGARFGQAEPVPASHPPGAHASLPKLIIGARLAFTDTRLEVVALAPDRGSYARLCRLLTLGKRRAEKGGCDLRLDDLLALDPGLILLACPPDPLAPPQESTAPRGAGSTLPHLRRLTRRFGGDLFLALAPRYDGRDAARFKALARLAGATQAPLVATGDVLMHRARRRRLADILTCIRTRRTIDTLGRLALPNAERRLRAPAEMARIFRAYPEALAHTLEITERCSFSLDELAYEYPDEGNGEPPQARLERLAREGLAWRYPEGAPEKARDLVTRELALIGKLNYAPYFLTVHDIVAFARSRGILAQGRGSAANSAVCYALGITEIPPETISMVFERFVSEARDEPPDIDVDFEHERREEVIQHIYETYGRHRAGLTATVIHFRSRAAIREVGRAMGLSDDVTAALSSQVWGWSREPIPPERLREIGLDPSDRRLVHSPLTVGASFEGALDVAPKVARPATSVTLPWQAGTWFIVAVDKNGHRSVNPTAVVTTGPGPAGLNAVETVEDAAPYLGSHDRTLEEGGALRLVRAELPPFFDEIADIDTVPDWDAIGLGERVPEGTYELPGPLDVGAVYVSRLAAAVTSARIEDGVGLDGVLSLDAVEAWDAIGAGASAAGDVIRGGVVSHWIRVDGPAGRLHHEGRMAERVHLDLAARAHEDVRALTGRRRKWRRRSTTR